MSNRFVNQHPCRNILLAELALSILVKDVRQTFFNEQNCELSFDDCCISVAKSITRKKFIWTISFTSRICSKNSQFCSKIKRTAILTYCYRQQLSDYLVDV